MSMLGRLSRRHWRGGLIVIAAVALVVAALGVALRDTGGTSAASPGTAVPAGLAAQLGQRVAAILEVTTPSEPVEGHAAGHVAGQGRVMCIADPFGIQPANATTVGQVRWVYAQQLCAVGEPGTPWEYAEKYAGPVAVSLTDPPVVLATHPDPSRDYQTQVRQLIPSQYLAQALGSFAHPELVAQLRDRFRAEVSNASPPAASGTPGAR
ncbi:MAG: hypothetical protein J2P15_21680 [Micromonosporaceae bacterium]|nr:hypothetical protein [Micromonosporaceae bacterium]